MAMELAFEHNDKDELLRILAERKPGTDLEYDDAIHRACENGWTDVVKVLIRKFQINPNVADFWKTEIRPIHAAAGAGEVETVLYLAANGALINSVDVNGRTALHYAFSKNKWKVAETLVRELKADILKPSLEGSVPLLVGLRSALAEDDREAFHAILALYEGTRSPCTIPYDVLSSVFQKDWLDELGYLLQIDQDKLKEYRSDKHTPVTLTAAENGDTGMIALFFKRDASPATTDGQGNSCLLLALKNGHWDCAEYIVKASPGLATVSNELNEGPVKYAARKGNLDVIKLLVENGAEPDLEDNDGNTPLLYAMRYDHRETVNYLVKDLHCDLSRLNSRGESPFSTELTSSLYQSDEGRALWLMGLNSGEKLAPPGKDALLLACQKNLPAVVDSLLQVYHCNPLGTTQPSPLQSAIKNRSLEALKILLAYKPLYLRRDSIASSQENGEIQKLMELSQHSSVSFARKPVKIFILGDQSSGKSSLAHAIKVNGKGTIKRGSFIRRRPTPCMKVRQVCLEEVGPVVIYDFSGNSRYQVCQTSVIKYLMRSSTVGLFVIVTDVSRQKGKVSENVQRWSRYLSSLCNGVDGTFHVITVGSFADRSPMNAWGFQNCSLTIENSSSNLINAGGMMLDCRKVSSQGLKDLLSIIAQSSASLRTTPQNLQFEHLLLYAYVSDQRRETSLSYTELFHAVTREGNYHSLPTAPSLFKESLQLLESKGLLLFLEDENNIDESQIVLKPNSFLSEVPGALLDPENGICVDGLVKEIHLIQRFPKHDPRVIKLFLLNLSLCYYFSNQSSFYFPSCLSQTAPTADLSLRMQVPSDGYRFSWILQTAGGEGERFPRDFFNSLHLGLAEKVIGDPEEIGAHSNSTCVWTDGFHFSDNGVQFAIELRKDDEFLCVSMSCLSGRELPLVRLRSDLIRLIHSVKTNCCNNLKVSEYIIRPVLDEAKEFEPSSLIKYDVLNVIESILIGNDTVGEPPNEISIQQLLHFEPCQHFRTVLSKPGNGEGSDKICCEVNDTSETDAVKVLFSKLSNEVVTAVMDAMPNPPSDNEPKCTVETMETLLYNFSVFSDKLQVKVPSQPLIHDDHVSVSESNL